MLCLGSEVGAATGNSREDMGIWFGTFLETPLHKIHSPLIFYLDFQLRFSQGGQFFSQGLFRPAVGYQLPYGFSVFLGWAYFGNTLESKDPLQPEHRIWEQLNWKWKFKKAAAELYSRTRLEQRFIVTSPELSVRLRQYFRGSWFFHPKSPVGLGLGSEMFIGFNPVSWSKQTGLAQHRFLAVFLLQIHDMWRLEAGYMHQWFAGAEFDRVVHVMFFRFFVNIP